MRLSRLTIRPERFERHLYHIQRWGYTPITPGEWVEWRAGHRPLPRKPIMLTFDDGYADLAAHAFPRLLHYGFRTTVFIVSGQIGGRNSWDNTPFAQSLLSADAVRYWSRNGIDFGAHSRTHPDLTRLSDAALEDEIWGCAADLTESLGHAYGHLRLPLWSAQQTRAGSCCEAVLRGIYYGQGLKLQAHRPSVLASGYGSAGRHDARPLLLAPLWLQSAKGLPLRVTP